LSEAAAIAWPGWWNDADLARVAHLSDSDSTETSAAPGISESARQDFVAVPVVAPAMPVLKRRSRYRSLLVSAAAGIAVSLGVFELIRHGLH
jgi:hypothetical protein